MYYLPPVGRHKVLVMLQAYFDESGIQRDSPSCIFAGFVGEAETWIRLSEAWSGTLRDFGLSDFHASDFFARDSRRRRVRAVREWTDERAERFVAELLSPVKGEAIEFIGVAIDVEAFSRLTENARRLFTGAIWRNAKRATDGAPFTPYFHAVQDAVAEVLRAVPEDTRVHFFFDSQDEFAPVVFQQFQELQSEVYPGDLRLGALAFERRTEVPALQLADLAAHLWYCRMRGPLDDERQRALANLGERWPQIKTWNADMYARWLAKCVPPHRADLFS